MEPYDIEEAFAAIEEELIASMMRNMKRHKVEESAEDKRWEMWQAKQLQALEKYKKQNQKKFQKQFSNINGSVDEIIHKARKQGGLDQETEIMNAIKKGWKPPGKLKKSMQTTGEFFKLNDRKLNALIGATQKDFSKAEHAMLRMADDQYRKIIFNAQVYANTGAGTYEKAVDMAAKDFLGSGINCIEYKNGARHKISDYAFMAIQTASKRAYLTGEGEKRQEWGISTVIVNKRGNPCPKCLPFVGKILVDDVWSGGKPSDGKYPLMSTAIAAGLYHPRCKDSHTTYFPGISTADDTWTKQELEVVEKVNKQEAQKQHAERQVEKLKRLAKFSLDEDNQRMHGDRVAEWQEKIGSRAKSQFIYKNEPVYYDKKNDYSVSLPEYDETVNRGLSEAIEDVAKKGNEDRCEHMHLVNLKTGKLEYYETNGDPGSVGIDFWKYVESHPDENFAFIHNHNIISSLSEADLTTPILYQNIPVQIAVQNDGMKYIAKRTKDADIDFYPDFYFEEELEDLNKLSRSGKITPVERSARREEIIIESILKEFYGEGVVAIDGRNK